MSEPFEDVSRWPVSRYFREVVAAQPDGRVLLFFGRSNIPVGVLILLSLLFAPLSENLAVIHAVLFLGMPLLGFVWFLKDMPSPTLTAFESVIREPWQRMVSVALQLFVGLLPWVVLVDAFVR